MADKPSSTMADKPSSTFVVIAICATQVMTMMGLFTFPALLPEFSEIWKLSNTEAGWISGIVLGAYAITVPVLVALTDRIDARLIHMAGTFLTTLSLAGFALFAEGFWSAFALRSLAGVALAATYMPGLRMLVDRYQGGRQARMVAFYTASFSLGSALSFYLAGVIGGALGWQWAFGAAAIGAAGAFLVILLVVKPSPPEEAADDTALMDFRPILRNREVLGYIIAYGAHSWELFAMRAWLVAFLAFSLSLAPGSRGFWPSPTDVAAIGAVIAVFASIFGNEAAGRFGRRRVVSGYLLVSAIMASFLGFLASAPYWALVLLTLLYAALIQLDSAALTAGAIEESEPGRRGATLGVHSFVGFMGAAAGPLAVGIVLDVSGGGGGGGGVIGGDAFTWGLGFIAMGLVGFMGPVALALLRGKATG